MELDYGYNETLDKLIAAAEAIRSGDAPTAERMLGEVAGLDRDTFDADMEVLHALQDAAFDEEGVEAELEELAATTASLEDDDLSEEEEEALIAEFEPNYSGEDDDEEDDLEVEEEVEEGDYEEDDEEDDDDLEVETSSRRSLSGAQIASLVKLNKAALR